MTVRDKVTIRQYRHPEDFEHVRRVFVAATMQGRGSPILDGMTYYAPPKRLTRAVATFILCLEGTAISQRMRDAIPLSLRMVRWVQGLLGFSLLARWIYLWYQRRKVQRMFRIFLEEALAGELGDIVHSFDLRVGEGGECVPTGAGGFWVAEAAGEVAGLVGLTNHKDPTIGDIHRLAVAPNHQRKGVAEMLMNALISHARAHNIRDLDLVTSDHNKSALRFYGRMGWKIVTRKYYHGLMLAVMRRRIGDSEFDRRIGG
ncbi:hypothetical protein D9615_002065 [Tricholomella constricta]|uniref:N-acetyltransferase domain-containing protein n=1 Tax=Tricholomella constricta TaxID=117010 RepID=A0A8H5MAQ4_9AGAR|nr:hypothetical protein D9615_002065 [Tricholomella constricta]